MKGQFVEPICDVVRFDKKILTQASICGCFDGTTDWGTGDSTCPNLNLPECGCKLNTTDPTLGNCV